MALLLQYRYLILFPLAVAEGPIIAIIAGVLVRLGVFNWLIAYVIVVMGDVVPDSVCYLIGYLTTRSAFVKRQIEKRPKLAHNIERLRTLWHGHPWKSILVSKFAYGLSIPLLISAGVTEITYFRFIRYALAVTMSEYAICMLLGYFVGSSYNEVTGYVGPIGYVVTAVVILAVIGYVMMKRYLKKGMPPVE